MTVLAKLFHTFIFSNIFIALCGVIMSYYTYYQLHIPVFNPYLLFVFFATLVSYSFHWFLTFGAGSPSPRVQWTLRHKPLLLGLFVASSVCTLIAALPLLHAWHWLLITAVVTFLYSAPKLPFWPFNKLYKVAIGKTIFLSLVWTHVTVMLPVIISGGPYSNAFEIFAVNRFFLIFPICVLFDFRDRENDIKEGLKSMINLLPEKGIDVVFWCSQVVFLVTSILLVYHFHWINISIIILPSLILTVLYTKAKSASTDYLYYFILDGLMMLSGLLAILFQFWLHLRA